MLSIIIVSWKIGDVSGVESVVRDWWSLSCTGGTAYKTSDPIKNLDFSDGVGDSRTACLSPHQLDWARFMFSHRGMNQCRNFEASNKLLLI